MSPKAFLVFSFLSFLLVVLAIGTQPAFAQNCSAKTCTKAYQGCAGVLCQREREGAIAAPSVPRSFKSARF
jgi:hypothetical protein